MLSGMETNTARALWERLEPVHDLLYFAPEARSATDELGMRGFWMGYFALRSAPLGAVPASVVTACFYVFHPDRVGRALPDAWRYAGPQDVLVARQRAMESAMRRLFGPEVIAPADLAEAADLAWRAACAADTAGRPLAAANQALDRPHLPHARLWQALTTLREHRGDGHVATLVGHRLSPVAAMVVKAAAGESDAALLRTGRKWETVDWEAAEADLRGRGWLDEKGALTAAGTAAHDAVEAQTDALAERPWTALGQEGTTRLARLLEPLTAAVREAELLPSGNPVGLTDTTV